MEQVILVNERDEEVGVMEKIEAHEKGELHRAFSIFIFNDKGEMLLQQRALTKYHSGGLWTNACCGHPRPNEETATAATRRLGEELGFITPLFEAFTFTYKASFTNGLTENEFDHVFLGEYVGEMQVNADEAQDICYLPMLSILEDIRSNPGKYTEWFKIAFPLVEEHLSKNQIISSK